ncbi:fluoride efflux transporter FluC [Haladaptatus sp. GCM10025707]|uniref:fluoride efflux transporter FluC n=1 Tax=unclassified Haladaptatus TaxID=2622732 RepID=UPI0023E8B328|nr:MULTISPECIES: CrcB family protein [unclassified Haladaptatus]
MSRDHPLATAEALTLIAVGGFAGANLRYATSTVLPGIPGTLVVNVVGSLLLGFFVYEQRFLGVVSRPLRLAMTTGFLSSLTTYSTFAVETALSPELALVNVVANYALGFAAVFVGRFLAQSLPGATPGNREVES